MSNGAQDFPCEGNGLLPDLEIAYSCSHVREDGNKTAESDITTTRLVAKLRGELQGGPPALGLVVPCVNPCL